jgi:1-acyl-sn-glycerol-3-phosphate acyltransferase
VSRPPFYTFCAIVSQPTRPLFRMRAKDVDNVPRKGGLVLAANHISNFDPWPIALPLYPRRTVRFMAKAELYRFPIGQLLRAGGAFPVRRDARDMEAVDTAVRLAGEGECVMIFPEGTRRPRDAPRTYLGKAHTGTARIALRAGVPILPAALSGTDRLQRLGPIRVVFGEPIPPEGNPRELTRRMMAEIGRLQATL